MLKNKLISTLILILILLSCSAPKKVQETKSKVVNSLETDYEFPDDWLGYWKGDLKIFKENKIVRSLPMALDHALTDTTGYYKWAIIYGEDTIAGRRDYYLKTIDAAIGHYQTDERNSIYLDSYLYENKLVAYYDVGNITIQSSYTRSENEMQFEIFAIDKDPISTTGNQIVGGDTIPEVRSYPIKTMQRAILKKVR